jgi:hypothetical protein
MAIEMVFDWCPNLRPFSGQARFFAFAFADKIGALVNAQVDWRNQNEGKGQSVGPRKRAQKEEQAA